MLVFHNNLDRILDPVLGIAQRLLQIGHVESVGVDQGRIEPLLTHEGLGPVGRRLAFAADAVQVDVVAHQVGDINFIGLCREGRQADLAAAVDHQGCFIEPVRRTGAFDDIVDTFAAGQFAHLRHDVLVAHVDHVIGTQLFADFKPVVARAGQDHWLGAQRLGNGGAHQADRPRSGNDNAFAGDQAAKLGQAVHRRARGDDQCRLFVGHGVVDMDQGIDVVHGVFSKAAIGGEPVGAMPLVNVAIVLAVVVAGRVHALAAALALPAARMDFDSYALADLVFVDTLAPSATTVPMYSWPGVKFLLNGSPPWICAGGPW